MRSFKRRTCKSNSGFLESTLEQRDLVFKIPETTGLAKHGKTTNLHSYLNYIKNLRILEGEDYYKSFSLAFRTRNLESREASALTEGQSTNSLPRQYTANSSGPAFNNAIIYSANYKFCRHGNPVKSIQAR